MQKHKHMDWKDYSEMSVVEEQEWANRILARYQATMAADVVPIRDDDDPDESEE